MCYHIVYYNKYNGKIVFFFHMRTIYIHTAFTRFNALERNFLKRNITNCCHKTVVVDVWCLDYAIDASLKNPSIIGDFDFSASISSYIFVANQVNFICTVCLHFLWITFPSLCNAVIRHCRIFLRHSTQKSKLWIIINRQH